MNTVAHSASPTLTAAPISKDDAQALTERIRITAGALWQLLAEANERAAWRVLGYGSFREYAKAEFGMAKSQAYRLLDQARVIRALADSADSPLIPPRGKSW